ncbi:uncharacterized protein EI90DRAFT_921721 [Cantharellus anzutake]|uniref:uncharacterized protein n=1 Tax=Cantharellus anzutake TaxID=1750568 RepID=UPI00190603F2|nr:uncharacterized protein EI90DRAFT_921721 [Cantharellus anzutake]KAF8332079.1 hypothetical protein EI90DRAFT_921721 [Cantharellus anzutake]
MSHSASPHPRPLGGRPLPAVPTIRRPSPSDCTSFTHHRPSTRSSFDYPLSSPQSGSPPPSHTPALSVSSPSPVPSVHARSARPVVKLSLPSKGQVYNNHTPSSTNSYDYQSDRSSFDDYPTPPPSLRSATNNNLKLQLPAISTNLNSKYRSTTKIVEIDTRRSSASRIVQSQRERCRWKYNFWIRHGR